MDEKPSNVKKFIEKFGSQKITKVWIVREPVEAFVIHPINLFTAGKVSKIKLEENYDNMYHLFVIFQLSDGTTQHLHKMEKNDIVKVYENEFPLSSLDEKNVVHTYISALDKYIKEHDGSENGLKTFEEVINECEKAEPCLWFYSAKNHNCQHFVHTFIQHILPNGVHFDPETKEKYEKFILQNGFVKLFEQKGLEEFVQTLTNLKAAFSRALSSGHIAYDNEYADNYRGSWEEDDMFDDQYDDQDYDYRSRKIARRERERRERRARRERRERRKHKGHKYNYRSRMI